MSERTDGDFERDVAWLAANALANTGREQEQADRILADYYRLRARLDAAEKGRCDTCFYHHEYAGDEWCAGVSNQHDCDCWRAREALKESAE